MIQNIHEITELHYHAHVYLKDSFSVYVKSRIDCQFNGESVQLIFLTFFEGAEVLCDILPVC
ncbi:MAG: hypothetical protein FMNOHCHN_00131 [Ignavibacteriaceae bacterium]|nr:hypothetical protein [Ignavibacteriaceae bacterium]